MFGSKGRQQVGVFQRGGTKVVVQTKGERGRGRKESFHLHWRRRPVNTVGARAPAAGHEQQHTPCPLGTWVVGPQQSPHTAPAFLVRTLYLLLFPSGHPLSTTAGFGRSHQRPWPWDRSILKLLDPMDTEHCVTVPLGSIFLSERAELFPSCFRCPWWDRSSRQESGNWEVRTWVFIQRHLPCPSLSPAHGAG